MEKGQTMVFVHQQKFKLVCTIMYWLVLTNTCTSTTQTLKDSPRQRKLIWRWTWTNHQHLALENYCMNDWETNAYHRKKKWMNECVFMTKAHTYFTKIYLENRDFTFINSTVGQGMDGSLER